MDHAGLVFEISRKMVVAAAIVDKQDDKVIDDICFIRISYKFENENMSFVGYDESKPRSKGINRDHSKNADDVKLILWMRVIA